MDRSGRAERERGTLAWASVLFLDIFAPHTFSYLQKTSSKQAFKEKTARTLHQSIQHLQPELRIHFPMTLLIVRHFLARGEKVGFSTFICATSWLISLCKKAHCVFSLYRFETTDSLALFSHTDMIRGSQHNTLKGKLSLRMQSRWPDPNGMHNREKGRQWRKRREHCKEGRRQQRKPSASNTLLSSSRGISNNIWHFFYKQEVLQKLGSQVQNVLHQLDKGMSHILLPNWNRTSATVTAFTHTSPLLTLPPSPYCLHLNCKLLEVTDLCGFARGFVLLTVLQWYYQY